MKDFKFQTRLPDEQVSDFKFQVSSPEKQKFLICLFFVEAEMITKLKILIIFSISGLPAEGMVSGLFK